MHTGHFGKSSYRSGTGYIATRQIWLSWCAVLLHDVTEAWRIVGVRVDIRLEFRVRLAAFICIATAVLAPDENLVCRSGKAAKHR